MTDWLADLTTRIAAALPWAHAPWWQAFLARTRPGSPSHDWCDGAAARLCTDGAAPAWLLWLPLGLGLLLVAFPPAWRLVRLGVTFAHELGHAVVGILTGRRFTGFVVRADMSGHAVTIGRRRGAALVLTTWAGYPMPALVALALVWLALAGWAPAVLGLSALACLITLPFVRSWTTAGVTIAIGLASGALWWWRADARSAAVLLVVAAVLLLGAWRHWAAVAGSPRGSDPAELARLTPLPGWFWVGTQLLVIAAASAAVGWLMWRSIT